MARTVLPIVGAAVGFYFGGPTGAQIGYAAGSIIGGAVDPIKVQGPRLGEAGAQTTSDGVPRPIIYGTISCSGNVIVSGPLIRSEVETSEGGKGSGPVTSTEHGYRTYAIRVCEGPIGAILRIWEDGKLVYDVRQGSGMLAESVKWKEGITFYYGDESQLPDADLETIYSDIPAFRGTAYVVFPNRDLTDRRGSIPQYRFEVAKDATVGSIGDLTHTATLPGPTYWNPQIFNTDAGDALGVIYTTPGSSVTVPSGTYHRRYYDTALTTQSDSTITLTGAFDGQPPYIPDGIFLRAGDDQYSIAADTTDGGNHGTCMLVVAGEMVATLKPNGTFADKWWSISGSANYENDGRRVWIGDGKAYVGTVFRNSVNVNNLCYWSLGGGFPAHAGKVISNVCATPGQEFYVHLATDDGKVRTINDIGTMVTYDGELNVLDSVTLPFSLTNFHGFGVDGDTCVFAYTGLPGKIEVRKLSDFSLVKTITNSTFNPTRSTRVVFTDDSCFVQCETNIARMEYSRLSQGLGTTLDLIVADICDRCKLDTSQFDVSELDDPVQGLLLAGEYTGADAINTLRAPYFFDGYNADKKIWFPKRGADASFVIDIDDLVEDPDLTKREQPIEYPKKIHLQYQHANSGYAIVKATSSRSSPDARVIGETAVSVPVVLDENQAAQTAAKMHKVAWAEADGEIELSLPDSFIKYTPTDVGSVTLRGQTSRRRIHKMDMADGIIKWTLKKDRQSAYTSDVEGVPVPDPTPPPSTIVGETILAVMDISSRVDSEDDLNIYYGVTGALPAWYGATVQRSLDGGSTYSNVINIGTASVIGYITGTVADASESYTDTTNTVHVTLYRDTQSIESISNSSFLSEGGAFVLENADGSWEIMQYRDCVEDSNGDFILSTLHRGLLNSGTQSHSDGALFVMLDRPSHLPAQSAWIGNDLTHRAPSFEQSPELAPTQTATYYGRSQIEWPVAYLQLSRNGTDISATWTPRHRFGTDDNPVASINFQGYRVTIDGGSNGSVSFDTTAAGFSNYDASSLGGGVTVTVSALNRITGAGPSTSGTI